MSTSNITQIISVQKNKVAQVVQGILTTKQTTTITTANTFYAVTAPSVTITPTDANSRIIIFVSLNYATASTLTHAYFRVLRDSTVVGGGTGGSTLNCSFGGEKGSTTNTIDLSFIEYDLPGDTSSHTYSLTVSTNVSSDTFYINRSSADTNNTATSCGASTIIVMEVLP